MRSLQEVEGLSYCLMLLLLLPLVVFQLPADQMATVVFEEWRPATATATYVKEQMDLLGVAYKRVGSMIRDAEMRHGVIGVVDVSEIMQAFVGYEEYAELLKWLGSMSDKYWDDNRNPVQSH